MAIALLGFACKTSDEGDGQDEATESTTAGTESDSTETAATTETESTETSTESEGTETATDTTESEGGSFYAGPGPDFMPDGAEPEVLLDGPQSRSQPPAAEYPMPKHGVRHRLPE